MRTTLVRPVLIKLTCCRAGLMISRHSTSIVCTGLVQNKFVLTPFYYLDEPAILWFKVIKYLYLWEVIDQGTIDSFLHRSRYARFSEFALPNSCNGSSPKIDKFLNDITRKSVKRCLQEFSTACHDCQLPLRRRRRRESNFHHFRCVKSFEWVATAQEDPIFRTRVRNSDAIT